MADENLVFTIRFNAQTGELTVVNKELDKTSEAAKKTEKGVLGLSEGAKDLVKSFGLLLGAREVLQFFRSSVTAAEEENEALRKLAFNLKANGISWEQNSKAVNDWAAGLQKATRFSDTEAFSSLDRMVRVTGSLSQAQSAVKLAMDLSVVSGKDLAQTQELLVNLLNGNQRALIEARREFGSFVGNATTAQGVLDNLSKAVAGASEEEESFTKSLKLLSNQLEDFKENVGRFAIPGLTAMASMFSDVAKSVEQMGTGLATAAAVTFNPQDYELYIEEANKMLMEIEGRYDRHYTEDRRKHKENEDLKAQLSAQARQKQLEDEAEFHRRREEMVRRSMEIQADAHVESFNRILAARKSYFDNLQLIVDAENQAEIDAYEKKEKLKKAMDEENKKMREKVAMEIAADFSNAMADTILQAKTFGEAIDGVMKNIERSIIQAITQMIVFKSLASAGLGGGIGGSFGGFMPWGGAFGASGSPSMPRFAVMPPGALSQNPSSVRAAAAHIRTVQSLDVKPLGF